MQRRDYSLLSLPRTEEIEAYITRSVNGFGNVLAILLSLSECSWSHFQEIAWGILRTYTGQNCSTKSSLKFMSIIFPRPICQIGRRTELYCLYLSYSEFQELNERKRLGMSLFVNCCVTTKNKWLRTTFIILTSIKIMS